MRNDHHAAQTLGHPDAQASARNPAIPAQHPFCFIEVGGNLFAASVEFGAFGSHVQAPGSAVQQAHGQLALQTGERRADCCSSYPERTVAHDADCHQFMLYTPLPGTPLYAEMEKRDRILKETELADIHGQYKFNFRHEHIARDDSKSWLDFAFQRDFAVNGPSLYRIMRTTYKGWKRYGQDADTRVRARFDAEADNLRWGYGAALWAMQRYLRGSNQAVSERIAELQKQIEREFGVVSRVLDHMIGPLLLWSARREGAAYPEGRLLEPRTFVDRRNWA